MSDKIKEDGEQKPKSKLKRRKPSELGRNDMENIRFLGDDYYTVAVKRRVNGRLLTRRARRVKGKQNAINKKKKFIQELSLLQHSKGTMKEPQWRDAREGYIKVLGTRQDLGEIGPGEVSKLKSYLENTKPWDNLWASDITEEMVMEIKLGRLGSEDYSDSARKDYLRAVKAVFNWLIKNRKLFVNPAVDIYIKKPRPNPVAWIRPELFNKMMEKAKDTFWEPVFFLGYYTGLRSGELYALKWSDIDFDENILHVNSSHNWKTKSEKTPKSGQTRMVDISAPELKNFLLKHKKKNTPSEAVYVFSRHNQWEKGHGPAKAVRRALTEAGYEPKTITRKTKKEDETGIMQTVIEKDEIWPNFHSLRASYTMNLLLMNTPVLKVQKILGHLDLSTTMHYIGELKKEDIAGTSLVLFEDEKEKRGKLKAV